MKAEKTRKLLYEMVMISDVQPPRELVRGAEDELTRIEELAAKGLRAEQAEREIEELIAGYAQSRDSAQEYEDQINYEGVRKGLWLAMHRLKGVE